MMSNRLNWRNDTLRYRVGLIIEVRHVHTLENGESVFRTVRPGLEQIIDQWADELAAVNTGTAELDYQSWKGIYNPEADYEHGDFRNSYAGRSHYKYATIDRGEGKDGNMIIGTGKCSKYDPLDYRYKNGFLCA